MYAAARPPCLRGHFMISFVLRSIPSLFSHALPVLLRLALLVLVFRGANFLIKQWKGLGKR